ncbi:MULTISPECIES: HAD family hydrolase [Acetobacter]|uniref:HAD family hydrolase n=1 Tax=Acetobacter oryzoeni TaxID=2500548 RepID=A0A5B9GIP4_9PROT|nr:HAD family hydrolase [Acetobacter oryzoeni]MCP1202456.1 Cof-type HAD-IIB family hydrolase [Acetobacter oryzoeni]QEE86168.1 HAD family hydrolase [Acetobacter oryzoeni]
MTDNGQNGLNPGRPPASRIRLVVSDMDGTLLTPEKQVTRHSIAAIQTLKQAGVPVCLVSSRPPGGMEMYFDVLGLHTPYGALNGGTIFNADRTIRSRLSLDPEAVQETLDMLKVHDIDAWLFRGHEWLVTNATGAYVEPEAKAVRMTPTAVPSFDDYRQDVGKVTGSSADYEALMRQELEIGQLLEGRASVARSCQCFLDITPKDANKGYALRQLASFYNIPIEEVACIGDMNNDVPMLSIGGLSIAMGQSKPEVAETAHFVTAPNSEDGWAKAMEQFVLPRVAPLSDTAGKTVS